MKYVKMLGLLTVAASALVSLPVVATAGTLTSPPGTVYTGTIKAQGQVSMHNSIGLISCTLTLEGNVDQHGISVPAGVKVTSLNFTGCTGGSFHSGTIVGGRLQIQPTSKGNGTVASSDASFTTTTFGLECGYSTNNTSLGEFTAGEHATIDLKASLVRTHGSFHCGNTMNLTGSLQFTTPTGLSVESASPLTSPAGTSYTGTIHADSAGVITMHNGVGTISCNSTVGGSVEKHDTKTVTIKNSTLEFLSCIGGWAHNNTVTPGSLEIHRIGEGRGTVTSTGSKWTFTMSGIECGYTTSSTHIGEFTSASGEAGHATIDIKASIQRTHGSFFCGNNGNLTGAYKVTTPTGLLLD